jgi:hypothetical protein
MALEQGFLSVLGKVGWYVYVAGRLLVQGMDGDPIQSLLVAPNLH